MCGYMWHFDSKCVRATSGLLNGKTNASAEYSKVYRPFQCVSQSFLESFSVGQSILSGACPANVPVGRPKARKP
jgi:hypothetical protein